jgi:hypothetical protein
MLGPVVQIPMLSMSNAGHHHSFRCAVAAELVSDNDARGAPYLRHWWGTTMLGVLTVIPLTSFIDP